MRDPVPIRLVEYLIDHWRYPVTSVGCAIFFPLILLFYTAGVLSPGQLALSWASPLQLVGLFLLLSLLPAYLLMCLTGWVRSSKMLFKCIEPMLDTTGARRVRRYQYARFWPLGVALGLLYAVTVNIGWGALSFDPASDYFAVSVCLVLGQLVLWAVVGLVLFLTLHEGLILHHHGRLVEVNLYDLDSLNGFGSAAINGLLMVVGALALSVVQSLDREFHWDSYVNGFYVGIPAAIGLVLLPTWSVHRRIAVAKERELAAINAQIRLSSTALDSSALLHLNGLLQRRSLVQSLRNWPMDLSLFSRFIIYVLIPPLAWAGAALTELFMDAYIIG